MDILKVFFVLKIFLQISEGLTWGSNSDSYSVCESRSIYLVWKYTLAAHESVQTTRWRKDNGTGELILVAYSVGSSFTASLLYTGRVNRIGDGSIEIKDTTSSDNGTYYLFLTLNTSITNNTIAKVSVLETPDNSCRPIVKNINGNIFSCKIPDACPSNDNIQARWADGSVGVFTCPSKIESKQYKCCAEGDSVTKCYNVTSGDLCADEIVCKGNGLLYLLFLLFVLPIILLIWFLWKKFVKDKKKPKDGINSAVSREHVKLQVEVTGANSNDKMRELKPQDTN